MIHQGRARPIDHLEDPLEAVGAPVVGIRDVGIAILLRVELPEEPDGSLGSATGLEIFQVLEVAAIHGQDELELEEVLDPHATGAAPELDSISLGHRR